MRRHRTAARAAVPAALAAFALAACGGSDPDAAPTTPPAVTTPPATATATATATASGPSCPAPPLPSGATLVTATVSGGKVTTEHARWSVKIGTPVRVAVTADVADEVHVHSYDEKQDTTPGCPTAIDFTANIPGSVEVELEKAGLELFTIQATS